jgi:arabinofuranosyltransferase
MFLDCYRNLSVMLSHDRPRKIAFNVLIVLIWTSGLSVFTFLANGNNLVIDDADIFFAYAQNLASGKGLIYAMDIPRVEGYTSTLWMLLSFIVFKFGFSEIGILIVSLVLFSLTHLISFSILERSLPRNNWFWAKSSYLLLVSLSFGYSSWMLVTLMDTTLWGFILVSLIYLLIYPPESKIQVITGALIFSLAAISRPESMILVPATYLLILLLHKRLITKVQYRYLLFFFFALVILTLFRYLYFGYPFPNTYYAKVSDSLVNNLTFGGLYILEFFTSSLVGILAFSMSMVVVVYFAYIRVSSGLDQQKQFEILAKNKSFIFLSFLSGIYFVVVTLTGGDHFNLFRMIQPIWPVLVLVLVLGLFRITSSFPKVNNFLFSVLVIFILFFAELLSFRASASWIFSTQNNSSPILHEFEISKTGRLMGIKLNQTFDGMDRLPNVGSITAGGISRTYEGTIFDLMGLNNSDMAHKSGDRNGFKNHAIFDKEIFLGWPIDILLSSPEGWGMDVALKGLVRDDRFTEMFDYGCMSAQSNRESEVCGFYSRKFLVKTMNYSNLLFLKK